MPHPWHSGHYLFAAPAPSSRQRHDSKGQPPRPSALRGTLPAPTWYVEFYLREASSR